MPILQLYIEQNRNIVELAHGTRQNMPLINVDGGHEYVYKPMLKLTKLQGMQERKPPEFVLPWSIYVRNR